MFYDSQIPQTLPFCSDYLETSLSYNQRLAISPVRGREYIRLYRLCTVFLAICTPTYTHTHNTPRTSPEDSPLRPPPPSVTALFCHFTVVKTLARSFVALGEITSLGSATQSQPNGPGISPSGTCPGCVFLLCSWETLGSRSRRLLKRDGYQAVSLRSCLGHLVFGSWHGGWSADVGGHCLLQWRGEFGTGSRHCSKAVRWGV